MKRRELAMLLESGAEALKSSRCSMYLVENDPSRPAVRPVASQGRIPDQGALQRVFKEYDSKGQGFVGAEEISAALKKMGWALSEEEVDDLLHEHGTRESGALRFLTPVLFPEHFVKLISTVVLRAERPVPLRPGGIKHFVVTSGEILRIDDAQSDTRFNKEWDKYTGNYTVSVLAAPVLGSKAKDGGAVDVLGVIIVKNKLPQKANSSCQGVAVKPYGVLGSRLLLGSGQVAKTGPDPIEGKCCVVDPAGLRHIPPPGQPPGGAKGAGAGESIYRWLGIHDAPAFPAAVAAAVTKPGDACHQSYALEGGSEKAQVIHAAGPDLRKGEWTVATAEAELATCYENILREFVAKSDRPVLRLPPVSGGIFSGYLASEMPVLTSKALMRGLGALTAQERHVLEGRVIELCIFAEADTAPFEEALEGFEDGFEVRLEGGGREGVLARKTQARAKAVPFTDEDVERLRNMAAKASEIILSR
mmetsp:Transcript_27779/g.62006  ORF Transcript_27779/g.62006 Transcript_27779/m.62006 type:complete len:476 (+) Transcript_27779:370-1797(+)